jgi:transcription initiation factor TFIIIB Brf1 subunit/transcription initiation factor TFIIB
LLGSKEQKLFRRLKKNYTKFLRIKDHEREYRILNILKKVTAPLDIPKYAIEQSAYLYKKIYQNYNEDSEKEIANNITLIAMCVYISTKLNSLPISIQKISETFKSFGHRVSPRLIMRDKMEYMQCIKPFILKLMRERKNLCNSQKYLPKMISSVINNLTKERVKKKTKNKYSKEQFKKDLTKVSTKVLAFFDKHKELKGGKNPQIFTASVIYTANLIIAEILEHKAILTQRMVSQATGVAEYSIRDHYVNAIKPIFEKFIPNKKGTIADFF